MSMKFSLEIDLQSCNNQGQVCACSPGLIVARGIKPVNGSARPRTSGWHKASRRNKVTIRISSLACLTKWQRSQIAR